MLKRIELDYLIICEKNRQEIFLGSYVEFLEKDGWSDSFQEKPAKKSKEQKQSSAKDRSKELKPLENEISLLEKKIEQEENKLSELDAALSDAYQKKLTEKIKELSSLSTKTKKEAEVLYKKLEDLYLMLEEKKNP